MKELLTKLREAQAAIHTMRCDYWNVDLTLSDIGTILDALSTAEMFTKIDLEDKQPDLPAENTVMWWLCRIADDEVRRKAVGNVKKDSKTREEEEDFENAVYSAFEWSPTEEGHDYWKSVATSEIPLLPTPEWKEYLELKTKP